MSSVKLSTIVRILAGLATLPRQYRRCAHSLARALAQSAHHNVRQSRQGGAHSKRYVQTSLCLVHVSGASCCWTVPRHLEQQLKLACKMQMDDGYMEQFPIGAIDHIGLPESTLPKEVCNNLSILHILHAKPLCCMYCTMMHSLRFAQKCVVSCRSYRFCPQTTTHSWSWLTTSAAMPSQAR